MTDYDITTDAEGHIKNGLRADVMRSCMENKNLLEQAGSIYVGTGEKIVIGEGTDKQITIAKTAALNPGKPGEVLMVKDGELKYSKLSEANFSYNNQGVVEGELGSPSHPLNYSEYFLKNNLYFSITQSFTGVGPIEITNDLYDRRLVYLSITLGSIGRCLDFGFFSLYPLPCKLYPINASELFLDRIAQRPNIIPYIYLNVSKVSDADKIVLRIEIQSNISYIFSGNNTLQFKRFR